MAGDEITSSDPRPRADDPADDDRARPRATWPPSPAERRRARRPSAASPLRQVRPSTGACSRPSTSGRRSALCGRLTAHGRAAFTAGGGGSCTQAFAAQQRVLRHKVPGVDDSGYTPAQWREVVDQVMAALQVTSAERGPRRSGRRGSPAGPSWSAPAGAGCSPATRRASSPMTSAAGRPGQS